MVEENVDSTVESSINFLYAKSIDQNTNSVNSIISLYLYHFVDIVFTEFSYSIKLRSVKETKIKRENFTIELITFTNMKI